MSKVKELLRIADQINARVAEREEVIQVLMACVLAGVHPLIVGPPGAAKSLLVEMMAESLGSRVFKTSGSSQQTLADYFGPVSLSGLKEDEYRRAVGNFLPGSPFAIIDEVQRISSSIADSLFRLMAEGTYESNGQKMQAETLLIMGTANDLEKIQSNPAFWDRWLVRLQVDYIQNLENWSAMMFGGTPEPIKSDLSPSDLIEMREEVKKLSFPAKTRDEITMLKVRLEQRGIRLSDRRWKASLRLLQAFAFLCGDEEVFPYHFKILSATHWDKASQRPALDSLLSEYKHPYQEIQEELKEELEKIKAMSGAGALAKSAKFNSRIKKMIEEINPASRLDSTHIEFLRTLMKENEAFAALSFDF